VNGTSCAKSLAVLLIVAFSGGCAVWMPKQVAFEVLDAQDGSPVADTKVHLHQNRGYHLLLNRPPEFVVKTTNKAGRVQMEVAIGNAKRWSDLSLRLFPDHELHPLHWSKSKRMAIFNEGVEAVERARLLERHLSIYYELTDEILKEGGELRDPRVSLVLSPAVGDIPSPVRVIVHP